ncbi:MAG TPA: molybdopterin-synthase adenylyltransferase MoeB [Thermoanaerobaculia bacterium]|nr:molybdopterin-synthase adenylyltransferase MoeB [Thermoanaerobaculia bacterium]
MSVPGSSVTVEIPTPLRRFTGDQAHVRVEASTVGEALAALVERHPALGRHLYDDAGKLRSFVNVFVGDDNIRQRDGVGTQLAAGETVSIIPSIAGGVAAEPARVDDGAAEGQPAVLGRATALPELTAQELRRYSRHLIMPEVGTAGQRRLKAARVLMIGTGGLGSPLGLYLAAAGVGRLGLVDFDVVDESNLHRQVLFGQSDIGRPKIEAAAERLREVNPLIEIEPYETRLDSGNALELFAGYDLVVDGTDNFPTRYLVNDACVLAGKPNVYGSIFRFEGQVSVFWGARGPCYRCLFPEPPPPGLVPSCAEGGVLGVLPGIIGALQANEVIKLIVGAGEPLIGRLVLFDALRLRFRELKLAKDPHCPVCSENPTQTGLIDYQQFCGLGDATAELPEGFEIDVEELAAWRREGRDITLLDVRTPEEWDIARIEGARLIPLHELPDRLGELDTAERIVAHCHHGVRSAQAVRLLREMGYAAVNLGGGIDAWSQRVDRGVPRY